MLTKCLTAGAIPVMSLLASHLYGAYRYDPAVEIARSVGQGYFIVVGG